MRVIKIYHLTFLLLNTKIVLIKFNKTGGAGVKISSGIANRILAQYQERLDFGLSIIDINGIVVSSTEKKLTGTFHEPAYTMIRERKSKPFKITKNDDYLGASEGICMVLHDYNAVAGAFAMLGDPERLLPLAGVMCTSLETALIYESQLRLPTAQGFRETYLRALVSSAQVRRSDLELWSSYLGFDVAAFRFPILVSLREPAVAGKLLQLLKASLAPQDIVTFADDGRIIIFKEMKRPVNEILCCYRELAHAQYAAVSRLMPEAAEGLACYVGPVLSNLPAYSFGCQCCFWLLVNHQVDGNIVFFYDFIQEYLYSRIPMDDMVNLLGPLAGFLDQKNRDNLVRIIPITDRNNYNLVQSSAELFLHKNTLSAAVERLKECTSTDPLHNSADRKLLWALNYYLEHFEKDKLCERGEED